METVTFQSAPPAEARGDPVAGVYGVECERFQSAPPAEARGDSRHAVMLPLPCRFQSAPPAEARGDYAAVTEYGEHTGFNPLPLPKQGEIPLPAYADGHQPQVSIRSPAEARGDRPVDRRGVEGDGFQSAPPAEARGDSCGCAGTACGSGFNPLPLPKQGEISRCRVRVTNLRSFQSAPPAEARGDARPQKTSSYSSSFNPLPLPKQGEIRTYPGSRGVVSCFNPLPLPKQGEIARSEFKRVRIVVSIRSPCRSKGRSPGRPAPRARGRFQSAPPAEARGDGMKRMCCSRR